MQTVFPARLSPRNKIHYDFSPKSPEQHDIHNDLQIVQIISSSKFPVYLVYSKSQQRHFAMKIFLKEKSTLHEGFIKESQFISLTHPNLVNILKAQPSKQMLYDGELVCVSYILMEYALFGDFSDLFLKDLFVNDEKLVRTYFHQLMKALSFLHKNRIAHMDIKLENLLLSEDFSLKLADFDFAFFEGDDYVNPGTKNFRAPEVLNLECKDPFAADVYSAGIILFALFVGLLPYTENSKPGSPNLWKLLLNNKQDFWIAFEGHFAKHIFFSKNFKSLFESMTEKDPVKRATVEDVMKSKWYNEPIYTSGELRQIMKAKMSKYYH
jgi:Serine/threonine protein kinase